MKKSKKENNVERFKAKAGKKAKAKKLKNN